MEIILLILFLIAIYLLAIVCVMFATNCSTKEAKALVINFIKDSISSESQTPICYYPTFIGIDDMGYPHSDIIENEFKDISDIFEQFYFYKCGRLDNRIWYSFKVSNQLKEMEEYDLIQYCENLCDTLIHRYMHKKNPSITHVNNLVYIHYQESILTIYIAITDNGTLENAYSKSKQREIHTHSTSSNDTTINESWSDR